MPRILFFDLETRLLAADLHPDRDAGWAALRAGEGGISALCIYDSSTGWCHLYDDHTLAGAVMHLEAADAVVGFASKTFDVPVIEGLLGRKLVLNYHYDILEEATRTSAQQGLRRHRGDWTLDETSKRTLGRGKINHGSHAKELAEGGRWGELFNYCCDDVHLTHDLFRYIQEHGGIVRPDRGFLNLTLPEWLNDRGTHASNQQQRPDPEGEV